MEQLQRRLARNGAGQEKVILSDALLRVTQRPALILGLNAGHLSVGAIADICVFDPEAFWRVEPTALKSQGKNTPYTGMEIKGKVRYTLVDGKLVYQDLGFKVQDSRGSDLEYLLLNESKDE